MPSKPKSNQDELSINAAKKLLPIPELPDTSSEELRTAWHNWEQYLREIQKPLTPMRAQQQIAQIATWTEAQAIANIERAIISGWRGIYEPSPAGGLFAKRSSLRGRQPDPRFANAF